MSQAYMEQFIRQEYLAQQQRPFGFLMNSPLANLPPETLTQGYAELAACHTFSDALFPKDSDFLCTFHPNEITDNQPHSHDFFELIYVYEGTVRNWVDGEFLTLQTGDICLMDPDVMHYLEHTPEPLIVINVMIRKEFQDAIFFDLANSSNLVFNFFVDCTHRNKHEPYLLVPEASYPANRLIPFLHGIIYESMRPGYMAQNYLFHIFHLFTLELTRSCIQSHNSPRPSKNSLEDLVGYIITHCQTITLEQLATHFHYNPTYLSRYLKKQTGKSFTDIRQLARIELAKDLIRNSDHDFATISAKVGYASERQFTQLFKNHLGMTPAQYRKQKIN